MNRIIRLFLPLLLLLAQSAHARLEIEITGGEEGALPIAVVPFAYEGAGAPPQDLAAIIAADLKRSGRFAPRAAESLPERPREGREVNFPAWRNAGIDNVVVGRIQQQAGRYLVQFQLLDTLRGTQQAGYSIPAGSGQLRSVAHQISDIIYERLTGERGAFNTHVAYVMTDQLADGKRQYRLAIADADGYNEQIILTSGQPLMSPAWSPDGSRLAYVSFEEGRSAVYVQQVRSGQREKVASFEGINSAPAWSPDGQKLALTLSRDGNPEIYILSVDDRRLTQVTRHYAIDTEPAWAPDGRSLVFTSDRGGRPQIYRVEIGSTGTIGRPQRITFEGTYNARAAFSADGKYLAMVHGSGGAFRIGLLELASGNLRVLTDTRLDESPSFAPNGSMIIYATEVGGRGVLQVVSVNGGARQRLGLVRGDVREPSWSPFILE